MTGFAPQPAILAPLHVEHFREKIGSAVWLYLHLLAASNDRGVALSRLDRLSEDLHASEAEVQEWLGVLHGVGLIDPTTPPPFLVIRLRFWPGEARDTAKSAAPNSYSSQAIHDSESKSSNSSYSGPDHEALLAQIIDVLGESDPVTCSPMLV